MLHLREVVVVEGKHDRIRLSQVVATPIVATDGFRIFKDKEQVALLRRLAAVRGLVILTDSDAAGFVIRQHLSGIIPPEQIKHAYCPRIEGKERRKAAPSKEGVLGVEGIDATLLEAALRRAGVTLLGEQAKTAAVWLTKARLYEDGLVGKEQSARRRAAIMRQLDLPPYLSTDRLLEVLNLTCTEHDYQELLKITAEIS